MPQFNMHDAKTRLSELVAMAERGEEVIIARDGKPAVRFIQAETVAEPEPKKTRGGLGIWEGKVSYDDDIFAPDEDLIELFYNGDIFPSASASPKKAVI